MYELKNLKQPLKDFDIKSKAMSQAFSEQLESDSQYRESLPLAGIFYEYLRIKSNFWSRTFQNKNPNASNDVKDNLIIQEFADYLSQTPDIANALQNELMKYPEFSTISLIVGENTLSRGKIEDQIRGSFDEIMGLVQKSAQTTLEHIEEYRNSIKKTYLETFEDYGINTPVICRSSPTNVPDGSNISPTVDTENKYVNEIVTGVFATSSYDDVSRYIAKGIMPGGVSMSEKVDIFPEGTFLPPEMQTDPENLIVAGSSFVYILPADSFEPQIDFSFRRGKCNLYFDGEWVSKGEQGVPFLSKTPLDRIDKSVYENRVVFERKYTKCKWQKDS